MVVLYAINIANMATFSSDTFLMAILSVVAHSFEQLTGSVYQIWLYLTEFTHCA